MRIKESIRREKYVVLHGQSWRFRVVKYIVIVGVVAALTLWKGWQTALFFIVSLGVLGIIVHFVFRWKTKAWTRSWGPYKKLDGLN
jgi:small-conductance mechanosensitive channel